MKIEGSVALVTGGASGLGQATAEMLSSKGARVVVVDLPRSAGEDVARRLGGRFAAGDVTSEEDVNRALDIATELGQLRIAVNTRQKDASGKDIKTSLLDAGKSESLTFTITKPGNYNFQCDVHPTEMMGTLTVQ